MRRDEGTDAVGGAGEAGCGGHVGKLGPYGFADFQSALGEACIRRDSFVRLLALLHVFARRQVRVRFAVQALADQLDVAAELAEHVTEHGSDAARGVPFVPRGRGGVVRVSQEDVAEKRVELLVRRERFFGQAHFADGGGDGVPLFGRRRAEALGDGGEQVGPDV